MAGRPRLASDEQILEAVARGIGRHGPRELTLAHIAEDVGLAPATLVQRFGSKRGLFVALAARGPDAMAEVFERARGAEPTAVDGLRRALADLVSGIASREVMANNVAMLALDLADDDMGAHAARQAQVMHDQVERFLAAAVEQGELVGADVDELTAVVLTVYNGALVTWAIDGSGELGAWLRRRLDAVLRPYRPPGAGA